MSISVRPVTGRVARGAGRILRAPAIIALAHIIEKLADVVPANEAGLLWPALFLGIPQEVFQAGLIVALGIRGQLSPTDQESGDKLRQGKGCCDSRFDNHDSFFAVRLKKVSTQKVFTQKVSTLTFITLNPFFRSLSCLKTHLSGVEN